MLLVLLFATANATLPDDAHVKRHVLSADGGVRHRAGRGAREGVEAG